MAQKSGSTSYNRIKLLCVVAVGALTTVVQGRIDPLDSQNPRAASTQSWMEAFNQYSDNLWSETGFNKFQEDFKKVYGLLTQSDEYLSDLRFQHTKHGAFRSAEGTPEQIQDRIQLFEDRRLVESLEEAKSYSTDIRVQDKQFKHYVEQRQTTLGALKNDDLDLIEVDRLVSLGARQPSDGSDVRRLLSLSQLQPDLSIKQLEEPYPTSCMNHGQLAPQSQTYYACRNIQTKTANGDYPEAIRVTQETYNTLRNNHTEEYSCYTRSVTKDVCVCPKGYGDYMCATSLYQKCFINITEPAFYQGCREKPDTPYYLYSVPGYDPCHFFDFSKSYEIKYKLECRTISDTGLVNIQESEMTGYEYRDVTRQAAYNPFQYVATNPETSFGVMEGEDVQVRFGIRDWKYLSNVYKTEQVVSDPEVLAGTKEQSIEIDFSQLEASDAAGETRFVTGGRAYFEANIFGYHVSSFTTKGFFDKEGYVEPVADNIGNRAAKIWASVSGSILLVSVLLCFVIYFCKQARQSQSTSAQDDDSKVHQD